MVALLLLPLALPSFGDEGLAHHAALRPSFENKLKMCRMSSVQVQNPNQFLALTQTWPLLTLDPQIRTLSLSYGYDTFVFCGWFLQGGRGQGRGRVTNILLPFQSFGGSGSFPDSPPEC